LVRALAGALVAGCVWDMLILSGRTDVVVAAERVGWVVASLDRGEALVGRRRVGGGDLGGSRRPEEADVRPRAVGRDGGPRGQRLAGPFPWRAPGASTSLPAAKNVVVMVTDAAWR